MTALGGHFSDLSAAPPSRRQNRFRSRFMSISRDRIALLHLATMYHPRPIASPIVLTRYGLFDRKNIGQALGASHPKPSAKHAP
jgi:hypothetical protein